MYRKKLCLLFLFCFTATNIITAQNKFRKYVFSAAKMGSPFTITIYGQEKDSVAIHQVADLAFQKVDYLNTIFSDYLPNSEVNRLSRSSGSGKFTPVSNPLFHLLNISRKASVASHGAFDITMGPVIKLWRKARKEQHFPDSSALRLALNKTGFRYVRLNKKQQSVRLKKTGMQLDFGGIAKGYIAQYILNFIKEKGWAAAMVDAGGDLAVGNLPPCREGWLIGIAIPEKEKGYLQKLLLLKKKAVATSGDIYQHLEWKGKRYSHIINPRTGIGVTTLRNVTVIANKGATADWLASACSILPLEDAFKLVKKYPGTGLFIAEKRGADIYKRSNDAFENYLTKKIRK